MPRPPPPHLGRAATLYAFFVQHRRPKKPQQKFENHLYTSVSDQDWIRIQSVQWIRIRTPGSGSRRAKITHINRKKKIMFYSAGCSLFWAECFSCSLDVLYGGLGISKLHDQKNIKFFPNFCSCKPRIWIGIQPKMLDPDPDPDSMNPDPGKRCCTLHAIFMAGFVSYRQVF